MWAGPAGANWQLMFRTPSARDVTDIEVDPEDATVIYVAVGGTSGDRVFRLRRTTAIPTEATTTAQPLSGLPESLGVASVAVDRLNPFTIYAGTSHGMYRARSTDNGLTWTWTPYMNGMPVADVRDLEVHPVTRVLHAATHGRGVYQVHTDVPVGTTLAAEGKVTLLRVQDPGQGFGPPADFLDVDAVISLDTMPDRFFGFQLRTGDANLHARRDMFNVLRDAFRRGRRVRIEYIRTGMRNGRLLRATILP